MEKALYTAVVVRYEQNAAFNESNKMPKKLFVLWFTRFTTLIPVFLILILQCVLDEENKLEILTKVRISMFWYKKKIYKLCVKKKKEFGGHKFQF